MLTANVLTRAKLQSGMVAEGTVRFGDDEFPVRVRVDTRDMHAPFVELTHQTRDWRDEREVTYRIGLVWSVPQFGGRRWWFRCPRTGRQVHKIYLPNGGWYFWSRAGYRLGYACQRETRRDRAWRKARKLNLRLGGDGDVCVPPKPKWMRWPTYERRVEQLEEAIDVANGELAIFVAKRFGIPGFRF